MELEVTPFNVFVGMLIYFVIMVFIPACFGIGMGGRKIYIDILTRLLEVAIFNIDHAQHLRSYFQ